ncbi:MAG: dUTP diphosphatase [Victivallales bacterium]|nr:dUTP diphosphatase [Victivallales bacterium]
MDTVKYRMADGAADLAPAKAHEDDAAYDIRANANLTIAAHSSALVPTGLFLELPFGFEAQIRPRSGLALKRMVTVLNSPGTIDAGYRGEVGVILINHSDAPFEICRGDRIAQMVIQRLTPAKLELAEELSSTARGAGGFGSTGVGN